MVNRMETAITAEGVRTEGSDELSQFEGLVYQSEEACEGGDVSRCPRLLASRLRD